MNCWGGEWWVFLVIATKVNLFYNGCLKTRWREQQTEAARLDAAIEENLARPGFGGSP